MSDFTFITNRLKHAVGVTPELLLHPGVTRVPTARLQAYISEHGTGRFTGTGLMLPDATRAALTIANRSGKRIKLANGAEFIAGATHECPAWWWSSFIAGKPFDGPLVDET